MKILFVSVLLVSGSVLAAEAPTPVANVESKVTAEQLGQMPAAVNPSKDASNKVDMRAAESEIPVQLASSKQALPNSTPWNRFAIAISVLGVMGCGAYFFGKKYLKAGMSKNQHTQIKVITQHYLGPKKSLAIVRVAGESILIGITDNNINAIKSLSLLDEDIPESTPSNFQTVFNSTAGSEAASEKSAKHNKKMANSDGGLGVGNQRDNADIGEEFSITAVKDFVSSKLKNMRSIQ